MQEAIDEIKSFILKIILPALIAISIKLAIQNKRKTISIFSAITSFITGIGSAYIFSGLVMQEFSQEWIPLIISVIAISGDKIGYYLIYKLNAETIMNTIIKNYKSK